MYETLLRPHEVYQVPALQSVGEISEKLKKAEARREDKRLKQIASAEGRRTGKRKRQEKAVKEENGAITSTEESAHSRVEADGDHADTKKARTEDVMDAGSSAASHGRVLKEEPGADWEISATMAPSVVTKDEEGDEDAPMLVDPSDSKAPLASLIVVPEPPASPPPAPKVIISKVAHEVRGHTSYLTFATLLPTVIPRSDFEMDATEDAVPATAAELEIPKSDGYNGDIADVP